MAPKPEYGSTPDMEKGGSDEDKPQKWWCFHATRRGIRTILVLIPLLALTAFDVYASYESMTSHAHLDEDHMVKLALHAMISFWIFVALLIWIPTVWLLIGWAEPFPKYLQLWVLALLVYLPIMYHFEIERMNSYFTSACNAFFGEHPKCSEDFVTAKSLMLFIIQPRRKYFTVHQ